MANIPKFLSRPFQGAATLGNFVWNGRWETPSWAYGSWTENEDDQEWLAGGPKGRVPKLSEEAIEQDKLAYKTLGIDLRKARADPEYNKRELDKVLNKLKAAGVEIGDDATAFKMAKAYSAMTEAQKKTYVSHDGSAKPQETTQAAGQKAAPGQNPVSNGKQKGQGSGKQTTASGATPVPPKNPGATPTAVTTDSRYNRLSTSDTGERADGAPVEVGDTSTRSAIKEARRESATTDALQARRTRQGVQNDMQSDDRRRAQEHLANQEELDANLEAYKDRRRAKLEAAHKARMDKRYESRTLTGNTDWENLGRDSTKRDFSDKKDGESDESWNARSGAVEAVKKLRDRFTQLGRKDADKNDFYAFNPNRMRDVSGLGNLFNKAVESGNLTDAQIEGLDKTLDMYEDEGRKTKATRQRYAALHDAENVSKYRKMYGMDDRDVFDDDEVKAYHKEQQAASRKKILADMHVAPGMGGAEGREKRISDFSDNWMKLVDNGLDVKGTFAKAMEDSITREAYKKGVASIAADDPERDYKVDNLRRRFVMNQAMREAGYNDKVLGTDTGGFGSTMNQTKDAEAAAAAQAAELTKELPGRVDTSSPESQYLQAVADSKADQGTTSEAPIASTSSGTDVLRPREDGEDKKAKQQAAKGGMVLRPRRRAS